MTMGVKSSPSSLHMLGQHLDGDGPIQAGVGGLVDLPHASRR